MNSDVKQLEQLNNELLLLQKVNNALNSEMSLDEILHIITGGLTTVYNYDVSAVHLLDDNKNLVCRSYSASSTIIKKLEKLTGFTAINYKIPLYRGSLILKVIETRKPVITNNVVRIVESHTNKKRLKGMAKAIAKISGMKSGIGVPLLAGDKVVGVIGIGSREQLSWGDVERLMSFGSQVGLAIKRKKAEDEIRYLKEFNENIVQAMEEGVLIENKEGYITFINPKMEEMLGFPKKELSGKHLLTIFSPDYERKVIEERTGLIKGEKRRFEAVLLSGDKKEIQVIVSSTPLFEGGIWAGALHVFVDISEIKDTEDRLRARALKYNVEKGRTYLMLEKNLKKGVDVFMDLLNNEFRGLAISRTPPEEVKKMLDDAVPVVWLSEKKKDEMTIPPFINYLERTIEDFLRRDSVVLLDRLDYLVTQNGFEEVLKFVHRMSELFYLRSAILILVIDPNTLRSQQLHLLKKETRQIELKLGTSLPSDLVDILDFICLQNAAGKKPSQVEVSRKFGITRPTTGKRVRELRDKGLILISRSGICKVLELTEKGKAFCNHKT
jgi:PAS domain S-box-containing protein